MVNSLKFAALAIAGSLVCAPGHATGFTTITQDFWANFATEGASEFSYVYQYNGPLRLYDVTIDWTGYAYTSFQYGDEEGDPYEQGFTAGVSYEIFGTDRFGNGVDYVNGTSSSGSAQCTTTSCSLYYSAGGTDVYTGGSAVSGFLGNDYLTVTTFSYIDPSFEYANAGVGGTITYRLGPVPEPASWALMLGGFGLVGGVLRRRSSAVRCA